VDKNFTEKINRSKINMIACNFVKGLAFSSTKCNFAIKVFHLLIGQLLRIFTTSSNDFLIILMATLNMMILRHLDLIKTLIRRDFIL